MRARRVEQVAQQEDDGELGHGERQNARDEAEGDVHDSLFEVWDRERGGVPAAAVVDGRGDEAEENEAEDLRGVELARALAVR